MVLSIFKYEFAKEFGEYRFMIEAKHDIKEYASLVDIAKERLLKSCKDEMSSMTIRDISGQSIFEMATGTNPQGG